MNWSMHTLPITGDLPAGDLDQAPAADALGDAVGVAQGDESEVARLMRDGLVFVADASPRRDFLDHDERCGDAQGGAQSEVGGIQVVRGANP